MIYLPLCHPLTLTRFIGREGYPSLFHTYIFDDDGCGGGYVISMWSADTSSTNFTSYWFPPAIHRTKSDDFPVDVFLFLGCVNSLLDIMQ